jgi:hypothetical protein
MRTAIACLLLVGVGLCTAAFALQSPRLVRAAVAVTAPAAPRAVALPAAVLDAAPKTSPPV